MANGGISDFRCSDSKLGKRFWTDGPQSGPCLGLAEQRVVRASEAPSPPFLWCVGCKQVPPHALLTIPLQPFGPAWMTGMSSASQQPCGGVGQGRGSLCPLTAWQCQGRRGRGGVGGGLPATRPLVLSPNSGAPGVCCRGPGWDRWCGAGTRWSGLSPLLQPC